MPPSIPVASIQTHRSACSLPQLCPTIPGQPSISTVRSPRRRTPENRELGYGERTLVRGNDPEYIHPRDRWSKASAPSSNVQVPAELAALSGDRARRVPGRQAGLADRDVAAGREDEPRGKRRLRGEWSRRSSIEPGQPQGGRCVRAGRAIDRVPDPDAIRRPRAGSRAGRSSRSDRPRPPGPGSAPRFARPERSSARDVGICRCPVWTDVNCAPVDRPLTSADGRHQNPVRPDPPRGSPSEAIPPAQFATRPVDRHPRHHPPRPGRHSRARLRRHARVQRPRRDDRRPAGRERRPRHAGPGRHRRPRARGPDRRPRRRRHDLCRPERQHRQWRRRQRLDQRRRRQQHDRRRHRRQHGLSRAPATT